MSAIQNVQVFINTPNEWIKLYHVYTMTLTHTAFFINRTLLDIFCICAKSIILLLSLFGITWRMPLMKAISNSRLRVLQLIASVFPFKLTVQFLCLCLIRALWLQPASSQPLVLLTAYFSVRLSWSRSKRTWISHDRANYSLTPDSVSGLCPGLHTGAQWGCGLTLPEGEFFLLQA